jgi:DNA-binding NarL/FixJ family response regulator
MSQLTAVIPGHEVTPGESAGQDNLAVLIIGGDPNSVASLARTVDGYPAMTATRAPLQPGVAAGIGKPAAMPDVVLLSLDRVPAALVIDIVAQVRYCFPAAGLLVIARYLDASPFDIMSAGAQGMLTGPVADATLLAALQLVADGRMVLDQNEPGQPGVLTSLAGRFAGVGYPSFDSLTVRERDVYRGLLGGLTNSEIARDLCVARSTVKTHIERILEKLGVPDRKHAIIIGYEFDACAELAGVGQRGFTKRGTRHVESI